MSSVEVAIPTWNRRDVVGDAVESVLSQGLSNTRVLVYDDGSVDGTCEVLDQRFGSTIETRRWEPNRGRFANMTRAFRQCEADYLMLLYDDEVLLPNSLCLLVRALEAAPEAAFAHGRARVRNQHGRVIFDDMLMAERSFKPPPLQDGLDFLRAVYSRGDYTWIGSCMFAMARCRDLDVKDRDAPSEDTALLLRAALRGKVAYVDKPIATHTAGNGGESVREGLVAENEAGENELTLRGVIGVRRVFERFLLNEGSDAFSRRQTRNLLRAADLTAATAAADMLGKTAHARGTIAAADQFRDALVWIDRPRSRLRLARSAARAIRSSDGTPR